MKVKVGDKVYNGEKEPVMVILSNGEKSQIANMHLYNTKYCVYPDEKKWVENDYKKIKEWMRDLGEEK